MLGTRAVLVYFAARLAKFHRVDRHDARYRDRRFVDIVCVVLAEPLVKANG